ncbi:MAG: diacylglycerol kinase [Patescibacteria group bacterium]
MLSFTRLKRSFADAWRGIVHVFRREQNFRIQVVISFLILIAIIFLPLRTWETVVLILLVMMVLTMEILNTAFEYFSDLFKPRVHPYVGVVKDLMAGAVLITALGALVIGSIILLPRFLSLLE